jgi:acyl-ACP thioesterase
VWVVRRTVLDVVAPFLDDRAVELATWCSGVAAAAADRRTTLRGDRGGRIESETTWIHLDRDGRPLRLGERFHDVYAPAAGGRRASTKLALPPPPGDAARAPWPLRATDADLMGHVNNAVYWGTVEELFADRLRYPMRTTLEYRQPIDVGELIDVRYISCRLWLVVNGDVRAAAAIS